MKDVASGWRRALLVFFLLLLFGALAVGYFLTFHLDTIRRIAQQQMVEAFGQNFTVGDIQVVFFPYPKLTLTDLQILEFQQDRPLFQAAKIQMDLGFLSVLQDKFSPKSLEVDKPKVYLRRNEQGQWNVELILRGDSSGSTGIGVFLMDYALRMENGFIQVKDEYKQRKLENIELSNILLQISNLSATKPMNVFFSANLNQNTDSQISFQGTISEANDFFSAPEEQQESLGPYVDVLADIELNGSDLLQIVSLFQTENLVHINKGQIKAQAQILYGPSLKGHELVLSDITILADEVDLKGQVNIAGLRTPSPSMISATWSSAPVHIEKILQMVPEALISEKIQRALADQSVDGKIEVVSATLSGSKHEDMAVGLIGEFKFSEGYADLGEIWGVVENVKGTVFLQTDGVQFKDLTGTYDSIPVSLGMGYVEFRDEGPWLSTELHGLVSSSKLIEILRNIFDWTDPNHPMEKFAGEGGGGDMVIRLAGPLYQPKRISLVHAQYTPQEGIFYLPGIKRPITDVVGTIMFSQTHIKFEGLEGMFESSPIGLQGTIKFQNSSGVFDNLRLTGRISTKDLDSLPVKFSSAVQKVMAGTVNMAATLSGPLNTPRILTLWNLDEVEMQLKGILHKDKGVKGKLESDLKLDETQTLFFNRLTLALPPVTLSGQGSFNPNGNGVFKASITASPFTLSSLPNGLTFLDNVLNQGAIEFSLNVDGKGEDWRRWNKVGWFTLSDGVLMAKGLDSPFSNILLRLKFNRHMAEVKRLEFHMKQSEARITGTVRNWETKPKVKFEMIAPQFDIDLLIPKGDRSPIRDILESVADTQAIVGEISFGRAWYKDLNFQKLKARLQIKDGLIVAKRIAGKIESGKIKGRLLVHLPVRQPATVKTWIIMEDVPFQPLETTFLSEENIKERLITGNVSVRGIVEGHGKDIRGVFPTLNGNLKVKINDGRIKGGTVIPKILALMNLPAVLQGKVDLQKEGYPFDTQSGTLSIENGVITSEDIIMDGPILKLSGVGSYSLVQDQLDLAVAASPLGPYFNLLREIPLFGLLLDGEQKGIDMALFDVKGSISDPIITPLPLESFAAGLTGFAELALNVLKNAVTLPADILLPDELQDFSFPPDDQMDEDDEF